MSHRDRQPLPRRSQRRARIMSPVLVLLTLAVWCSSAVTGAVAIDLAPRDSGSPNTTFVNTAILSFMSSPRASWEQGVASSAILETYGASWSVFSGKTPPPYGHSATQKTIKASGDLLSDIVSMASAAAQTQDSIGRLCSRVTGDESTTSGSALDSASCGEAVLLAAYYNGELNGNGIVTTADDTTFATAAQDQLNYLLQRAPRTSDGAISMRQAVESYWSDGLYMAPPFIALYGLLTGNQTLMLMAYDQISLYRNALRIPSGAAQGLLRHIVNATAPNNGTGNDNGAWLTGNAWATAGMARVIATMIQSPFNLTSQINDLGNWATEIVRAAMGKGDPLLHNYINDSSTFYDAGGSALMAYSAFRLASLFPHAGLDTQTSQAESIYQDVQNQLSTSGAFKPGFQVANPLSFTSSLQRSPESMAFMALMSSARRDYSKGNVTTVDAAGASNNAARMAGVWNPLPIMPTWLMPTLAAGLAAMLLFSY